MGGVNPAAQQRRDEVRATLQAVELAGKRTDQLCAQVREFLERVWEERVREAARARASSSEDPAPQVGADRQGARAQPVQQADEHRAQVRESMQRADEVRARLQAIVGRTDQVCARIRKIIDKTEGAHVLWRQLSAPVAIPVAMEWFVQVQAQVSPILERATREQAWMQLWLTRIDLERAQIKQLLEETQHEQELLLDSTKASRLLAVRPGPSFVAELGHSLEDVPLALLEEALEALEGELLKASRAIEGEWPKVMEALKDGTSKIRQRTKRRVLIRIGLVVLSWFSVWVITDDILVLATVILLSFFAAFAAIYVRRRWRADTSPVRESASSFTRGLVASVDIGATYRRSVFHETAISDIEAIGGDWEAVSRDLTECSSRSIP